MGACVEKLPHDCGSGDGMQVFKDGEKYDGYCFACGTYVADPYHDKPEGYVPEFVERSPEDIQRELETIDELPSVTLHDRKLNAATLDYFDVKVSLSEEDGETPTVRYLPYTNFGQRVGYKAKACGDYKRMWGVGEMRKIDLFGWNQAINTGSKRLFITEGEEDAMAVYQAIKQHQRRTKWADLEPAVVSLAKGSGSARAALADNANEIKGRFSEVVLVFDMDEAGRKAVEDATLAYPTAMTVALPAKDANACLIEGRKKALATACLFNMAAPKNTRIVNGNTLIEAGRQQAELGLSWPWQQMTDLTRGVRMGETIYIGAGVKMGKSEVVNALARHFIVEHGLKVFLAKPEEANRMTWKKMLGKCVGSVFHDPKVEFDYNEYDRAVGMVGDNLLMLNLWQHVGWDTLRSDIVSAAKDGAKVIFIDPITNLINNVGSAEADTMLKSIAQELSAMAKDLDIAIFIFCHLKAPLSGEPHERGGKVQSNQFAGSRAMMRSCNYMIGLEGNKDPDLHVNERNIRRLVLLEDREFGEVGVIRLFWDKNTQLFNEMEVR